MKTISNKAIYIPEEIKEMTFPQALEQVIEGKRITRVSWSDKRSYYLLKDGLFQLHKAGEAEHITHPFVINDGDLLAFDWIEL